MTILVVGGTGTVGSYLVRELVAAGETVRVLTRSAGKIASIPAGAEGVVGDLDDPRTLGGAFTGADSVFLLNPVSNTELQQGLVGLNEAKQAGVRHVVYLSVHNVRGAPQIPHFASKMAVELALEASDVPFTVLRPSSYNQNDYRLRDVLLRHGVFPTPLGQIGISKLDVRDVAHAASNAFRRGGENRTYTVAGPDVLTGPDCAEEWSRALGREIRYGGDDLDAYYQQILQLLPAWLAYDLRLMHEHFQRDGLAATGEQLEETRTILGREPRSYADFVRETAATWLAEPIPA